MATNIYSNAFNFSSYLTGKVDLRTGQYGFTLKLATLHPRSAPKQTRDIVLTFSALSTTNIGYGKGWTLNCNSVYDDKTDTIRLFDGTSYQAKYLPNSGPIEFKDKKIKDTVAVRSGDKEIQVFYKNGIVEVLTKVSDVSPYQTTTWILESGETFHYHYDLSTSHLTSITNADGTTLLSLTYQSSGREIRHADTLTSEGKTARVTFAFTNENLTTISLPYDPSVISYSEFGTQLNYDDIYGFSVIRRVVSPVGDIDTIAYNRDGHLVDTGIYIPNVREWTVYPGGDQPIVRKTYQYSLGSNFLGYPVNGGYREGIDNLYLAIGNYSYWGEERVVNPNNDTDILSYTKNTFNKFHLQTEEVTQRGNARVTETTTYNEIPGESFENQPANLRLPNKVSTTYEFTDTGDSRTICTELTTDEYGNIRSQIDRTGIKTEYEYYPQAGESGKCPAEPFGYFVRYLKQKTIVPAPIAGLSQTNKVMSYTFTSIPRLPSVPGDYFVVKHTETSNGGAILQTYDYYNDPNNFRCGLLKTLSKAKSGKTLIQSLDYIQENGATRKASTVTGFDGLTASSSQTVCDSTALVLQQVNIDGVISNTKYDVLGRVVKTTSAVGTPYETQETHEYKFVGESEGITQSQVISTDAMGVRIRVRFDGLGRTLTKEMQDDTGAFCEMSKTSYDSLGQKITEVNRDYSNGEVCFSNTKNYIYDNFGKISEIRHSDGRIETSVFDPIALTLTEGLKLDRGGDSSLSSVRTTYNLAKQPIKVERLYSNGSVYSTATIEYDGFGRKKSFQTTTNQTSSLEYDSFDRVVRAVQFDGNEYRTEYADWSQGALIEKLSIADLSQGSTPVYTLGEQKFDGLGRTAGRTVGGRNTVFAYNGSQDYPTNVTTPRQNTIDFKYLPELNLQPQNVTTYTGSTTQANNVFNFAHKTLSGYPTGSLISVENENATYTYRYSTTGLLNETVFTDKTVTPNETTSTRATHTLAGVRLSTSIGPENSPLTQITYSYDSYGRPISTEQNGVRSTTQYDAFGRVQTNTTENATGEQQVVEVTYDEFSRETERHIVLKNSNSQTLYDCRIQLSYDKGNKITERIHRVESETLTENFTYDVKNRLLRYTATATHDALLPKNEYGLAITTQVFAYDLLDNMRSVTTDFSDRSNNVATYFYENADNRQVSKIANTHPSYPSELQFRYDADGNLIDDGAGRTMEYTTSGRLARAIDNGTETVRYRYDPYEHLLATDKPSGTKAVRHYVAEQVALEREDNGSTIFVSHNGMPIAEIDSGDVRLLGANSQNSTISVFDESTGEVKTQSYTPYGANPESNSRIGFNGELKDRSTGLYHLGNGTRTYNPNLGLFASADTWSPFNGGGINPYLYCHGNPLNLMDPSGHFSTGWDLGLNIFSFIIDAIVVGLAIASIATGAGAILGAAGLALLGGSLGLVSDTLGIAADSMAIDDENRGLNRSDTIQNLGFASGIFGLASIGIDLGTAAWDIGKMAVKGSKLIDRTAEASKIVAGYDAASETVTLTRIEHTGDASRSLSRSDNLTDAVWVERGIVDDPNNPGLSYIDGTVYSRSHQVDEVANLTFSRSFTKSEWSSPFIDFLGFSLIPGKGYARRIIGVSMGVSSLAASIALLSNTTWKPASANNNSDGNKVTGVNSSSSSNLSTSTSTQSEQGLVVNLREKYPFP
ncbi:RHS repeat-associated core domain-containing protein [Baaleninema simplex]|uniref:RHS repeat-associated core domain-containing protein n=1 Tax=Baaleninema simplex TaxID=2862350 RepID=UPI00034D9136|nr:RHS repeat-associated core domain-containing protein [Baaleninema simplex]